VQTSWLVKACSQVKREKKKPRWPGAATAPVAWVMGTGQRADVLEKIDAYFGAIPWRRNGKRLRTRMRGYVTIVLKKKGATNGRGRTAAEAEEKN